MKKLGKKSFSTNRAGRAVFLLLCVKFLTGVGVASAQQRLITHTNPSSSDPTNCNNVSYTDANTNCDPAYALYDVDADTTLVGYAEPSILSQATTVNVQWFAGGDDVGSYSQPNSRFRHKSTPGVSTVQWEFYDTDGTTPKAFSLDILIRDLDLARNEKITISKGEIAGYTVSSSTNLSITDNGDGTISFLGTTNSDTEDDAVLISIGSATLVNIIYENTDNGSTAAAEYDHDLYTGSSYFSSSTTVTYDTDRDGIPDDTDWDDDNDGILDVDENCGMGPELVVNGDFEDAYAHWTSDFNRGRNNYAATAGGCSAQGWVAVSPCASTTGGCNPYYRYDGSTPNGGTLITDAYGTGANVIPTATCNSSVNSCLAESLPDHTSGTGFSVYVDPNDIAGESYWMQTVTVSADTWYSFSAWIMVIEEDPNLEFKIDGNSLTGGMNLDRQTDGNNGTDEWQQVSADWYSGSTSGNVVLELSNLTAGCAGNDIRIDDISLKAYLFCDMDSDGLEAYEDNDTDGDGCPDAVEGGGFYTYSEIDANEQLTLTIDSEGIPGGSGQTAGDSQDAGTQASYCADTDGDGVYDTEDLDDDNDGILDTDEGDCSGSSSTFVWENQGYTDGDAIPTGTSFSMGTNTLSLDWSWRTDGGTLTTATGYSDYVVYESGSNGNHTGLIELNFNNENDDVHDELILELTFNSPVDNLAFSVLDVDKGSTNDWADGVEIYYQLAGGNWINVKTNSSLYTLGSNVGEDDESEFDGFEGTGESSTSQDHANIDLSFGSIGVLAIRIKYFSSDDAIANPSDQEIGISDLSYTGCATAEQNTDGDLSLDHLDNDADADGCPDAIEGAGQYTQGDIDGNERLTAAVDTDGIPGGSSQAVGLSQNSGSQDADCTDTDGDGINDSEDLDDDNDGILDTDECSAPTITQLSLGSYSYEASLGGADGVNDYSVGDVYRYSGAATDIDVLVEVLADNPSVFSINNIDNSSGDQMGVSLHTDPGDAGLGLLELQFTFVETGTTTDTALNFIVASIDVDGSGDIADVFGFSSGEVDAYSTEATTQLSSSANGSDILFKTDPITPDVTNVDPDFLVSATFVNLSTIRLIFGVDNGGSSTRNRTVELDMTGSSIANFSNESETLMKTTCVTDTDSDGDPNSLDPDADGDGCADAIEGGASFTDADLDANDRLDYANISPSGLDVDGVPNAAAGGQAIGDSQDAGTLAGDCAAGAGAPIELLSFGLLKLKNGSVKIRWETLSETNNDFFTLQRSKNAEVWEELRDIPGAGDSQEILKYEALDYQPIPGTSYYRLKQTDFNGAYSYSQIQDMYVKPGQYMPLAIYPNPTQGPATLSGPPDEIESFQLFDIQGRAMTHLVEVVEEDYYQVFLDFSHLPKGIYLLKTAHQTLKVERE